MKSGILQRSGVALVLLVVVRPGLSAEPLRYRVQPMQRFGYEVTIKVDHSTKTDIYQGPVLYYVKSVSGDTINLSYQGGLAVSAKTKKGNEVTNPEPFNWDTYRGFFPKATAELVLSSRGQVVGMTNQTQLPHILGNLSLLVFEAVPDTETEGWTLEGTIALSGDDSGKTTAATTRKEFRLSSDSDEMAVYKKTYSMKAPENNESANIECDGVWKFSRKLGLPESLGYTQKLSLTKGNASLNLPMQVSYRLLTSQEHDKVLAGWVEEERKAKEAKDKFWADKKRQEDEKKRLAEAPLTPQEKSQAIATLKDSSAIQPLQNTLGMLSSKTPLSPDPEIVQAIRSQITHQDPKIKALAAAALSQWDSEYRKKYALKIIYQGPGSLKPSELKVESKTKLVIGQILAADEYGHGHVWYAAEVEEVAADGNVKVKFRGWSSSKLISRKNLRLAPPELEQPEAVQRLLAIANAEAGKSIMRMWSDVSGKFSIEAEMSKLADGKVTLKRKDGREIEIPLEKLSAADQEFAKQPPPKPVNPFE